MNRDEIEKCYKFIYFISSSEKTASKVINLLFDRYEFVNMDRTAQCLYSDSWSFVQSLINESFSQKIQAKAVGYLFYRAKMTIEEISETLGFGRSSTVALLNLERERICGIL